MKKYAVVRLFKETMSLDPYVAMAEEGLREDSKEWRAEKRGLTLEDAEKTAEGLNLASGVMES